MSMSPTTSTSISLRVSSLPRAYEPNTKAKWTPFFPARMVRSCATIPTVRA